MGEREGFSDHNAGSPNMAAVKGGGSRTVLGCCVVSETNISELKQRPVLCRADPGDQWKRWGTPSQFGHDTRSFRTHLFY